MKTRFEADFKRVKKVAYPNYYMIARAELGLHEQVGPGSNPRIMAMADRVSRQPGRAWVKTFYASDDVPWCALGVSDALVQAGHSIPDNPLSAGAYRMYGTKLSGPMAGAIAVKARRGGNHVGLVSAISVDGKHLLILGFNQGDAVREDWYLASVFDAFRAPAGVKLDDLPRRDLTPSAPAASEA